MQLSVRDKTGTLAVLAVGIVVALVVFWLQRDEQAKHKGGAHARVTAGAIAFSYPNGWAKMPKQNLPSDDVRSALDGKVVAGLCVGGPRGEACRAGVGINYVLLSEGQGFPGLATLEQGFERSFPTQMKAFDLIESDTRVTRDGTRYLWFEFTFEQDSQRMHQVIAAYTGADGRDVLVVASGPQSELREHRSELRSVLDGATAAH
jgi:hypothetical protein